MLDASEGSVWIAWWHTLHGIEDGAEIKFIQNVMKCFAQIIFQAIIEKLNT